MESKSSFFVILGYVYVLLPILIFFIGYCNIPTAIIGTLVILIGFYFLNKNAPELWIPNNKKEVILLLVTALLCFIWVYSSGIGALVFQNMDHNCRNPIFENLVNMQWPVLSEDGTKILTYYIGFWMPAAVIGKIFNSIQIGYYAQVVWAFIGVFLTLYYVLSNLKNKTLLPVIIFIFFSGLDILGCILTKYPYNPITIHLEWWFPGFQFSSFTTQLYWVFNQAIPAWVITMLLFSEKNNKNIVLIYSCMFLCSTLPAIGIFPMAFWWGIQNGENDLKKVFTFNHIINSLKSGLTLTNLVFGLFITYVCYAYLSNNISGSSTGSVGAQHDIIFMILWICLFFLFEAGIYILCIFRTQKKNPLFYICVLSLLCYPFFKIGSSSDFCMRATIPALIILYFFIIKALENTEFLKKKYLTCVLISALLIGSVTPIHEMARTVILTSLNFRKIKSNLQGNNFYGYIENNKFLKYFGKSIK